MIHKSHEELFWKVGFRRPQAMKGSDNHDREVLISRNIGVQYLFINIFLMLCDIFSIRFDGDEMRWSLVIS